MTFSAGAILTAAQLNDISITSIDVAAGSVTTPCFAQTGDLNTGIYFPAAGDIGFTCDGALRLRINNNGNSTFTGITGTVASLSIIHYDSAGDSAIYFGDATDAIQAAIYYDESATDLEIRGYNNQAAMVVNAAEQVEFDPLGAASQSLPPVTVVGDTNTGVYWPAADEVAFTTGGVNRFHVTNSKITKTEPIEAESGIAGTPSYSFTADADTGMFLAGDGDLRLAVGGSSILRIRSGDLIPNTSGTIECGVTAARWQEVWSVDLTTTNAASVDSDMRLKTPTGGGLGLEFLAGLDTFEGVWTDGDDRRVHQWCSAQNVAQRLTDAGYDPAETSLWRVDEAGSQRLAYGELIPPLIAAVKELSERLEDVEAGL